MRFDGEGNEKDAEIKRKEWSSSCLTAELFNMRLAWEQVRKTLQKMKNKKSENFKFSQKFSEKIKNLSCNKIWIKTSTR